MESDWTVKALIDLGTTCYASINAAHNLAKIWDIKGHYWDITQQMYSESCYREGVSE
jgi:hypothetical protein